MTDNRKPTWQELSDEAAIWLARMDSGSVTVAEFESWRDADPRHAAAFVQIASSLVVLDRVKPELKSVLGPSKLETPRRNLMIGGAVSAATVGVGFAATRVFDAKASVRTGVGEQRTIALPSGGTLRLNTDSAVQWHDKLDKTEVWLRRGEISIDTMAAVRPCVLHISEKLATLSQSIINARLRGNIVDLSVVIGRCTLSEKNAKLQKRNNAKVTTLTANQAVVATAASIAVRPLSDADIEGLSAWPRGELVFQGQTLETAVDEYNRYLTRKIVVIDSSLNAIRLGGRFTTHDPKLFLHALHAGFDIKVIDDGVGTIALTK